MLPRIYRPGISEIDDACELLMARSPGESRRYILATKIVASGAISHSDTDGWTVASQSKAGAKAQVRYAVTSQSCTCYDFLHHGGTRCKHMDALALYARVLGATLDSAMPLTPEELFKRVRLETGDVDRAAAAADGWCTNPARHGDSRIEVLPGDASNRRFLYDAETKLGICTAQQSPNGQWRPCTAVDTVAWARWLGWQQGEPVEVAVAQPEPEVAAPHYAGGMLERILSECPSHVNALTLKADAIYGSHRTYTLVGYRFDGDTWVKLAHEDRQQFNEAGWAAVLESTGWIQPARPTRSNGIAYNYSSNDVDAWRRYYDAWQVWNEANGNLPTILSEVGQGPRVWEYLNRMVDSRVERMLWFTNFTDVPMTGIP